MTRSFLQRLFGRKKEDRDLRESSAKTSGPAKSLFAFVDLKDPFTPGEIAGEELPGPVLSILSAKEFGFLFLFHTPHTRKNAFATVTEIARRYPTCRVRMQQLLVSNPKDYSSLMGTLWPVLRKALEHSPAGEKYVCVSSGTAEMRAAWFLLATLGVMQAKLLQVGSRPLFGKVNVKELRVDTSEWQTNQLTQWPEDWKRVVSGARDVVKESKVPPAQPWALLRRMSAPDIATEDPGAKKHDDVAVHEESEAGAQMFGFDRAFVERMRRLYGARLEEYDWPGNVRQLSNVLERSVLFASGDVIQAGELRITEDQKDIDPLAALPQPYPGFKIGEYLKWAHDQLFLLALDACNGNQTEAAKLLDVTKQAVSKFVAERNGNKS